VSRLTLEITSELCYSWIQIDGSMNVPELVRKAFVSLFVKLLGEMNRPEFVDRIDLSVPP
jgi:hypothetical protein